MDQLAKKLQNFWFYYKTHLLIGLAVVFVLGYLAVQKSNTIQPDYHIGLVREIPCTDAELQSMEDMFTAAGTDVNGDGQIVVQLHTYYVNLSDDTPNAGVSNADTVAALDADLVGNMSGIFLLEDVTTFQRVTNNLLSDSRFAMENGLYLTIRKNASDAYIALTGKLSDPVSAP